MMEEKEHKFLKFMGILLLGVLIGAGSIYYFGKNKTYCDKADNIDECPKCECDFDKEKTNKYVAANSSLYEFLKLEHKNQNVIYSPLSIKIALNMVRDGAYGNTKDEIVKFIGHDEANKYTKYAKNVSLANALFITDSYKNATANYASSINNKYNADIVYAKSLTPSLINSWVNRETLNLIPNAIDSLDNDVMLVIVNALGLNVDWKYQFKDQNTHGQEFVLSDGTPITATMMNMPNITQDDILYYQDSQVEAVSLPLKKYGEYDFEFVAIMPNDDISSFINNIDYKNIDEIISKLSSPVKENKYLNINIPKFKFDYKLNFVGDLMNVGIKDMFDPISADFSKMGSKDFYVSDAIHKSTIDFSEKGIKASAVTAFMFESAIIIEDDSSIDVNFNKPFIFLIIDKTTNEYWFVGTLEKPNLWEDDIASYR